MRCNFNQQSTLETCVREVCAPFANMTNVSNIRQSPVICLNVHVKTCSFLRTLWQVTSPGSMGMTQRQNSNHYSGRVPRLHDQRRGARCEGKQRSCYWCFLILRVSYTTSTLSTGKQLTRNSMWRSCDVCVNQFAENNQKNGGMVTGSCTTTMRPHTLHILCSSFWPNGAAQLQQPPYSPDLAPCDFFPIPRA